MRTITRGVPAGLLLAGICAANHPSKAWPVPTKTTLTRESTSRTAFEVLTVLERSAYTL